MKISRFNGVQVVLFAAMLGVFALAPVSAAEVAADTAKTKSAAAATEKKEAASKCDPGTGTSQQKPAEPQASPPAPSSGRDAALSSEVLEKLKQNLDSDSKYLSQLILMGVLVFVTFVWLGILSFAYLHKLSELLATLNNLTKIIEESDVLAIEVQSKRVRVQ